MLNQFTEDLPAMQVKGRDGYGIEADYIPFPALKEYWSQDKVRDVLRHGDGAAQNVMPRQVTQEFLRVFSILVYIGKPDRISLFTTCGIKDEHLPLLALPPAWSNNWQGPALFPEFEQAQWMFCPLEIDFPSLHRRKLDPRVILPVTYDNKLGSWSEGDPTEIWKVKINGGCSNLSRVTTPDGANGADSTVLPTEDLFAVFKTCSADPDAKEQFDIETNAYASLPDKEYGRYREHILVYYGSFIQNGKHTIILEFAEGGTLLQFFEKVPRPTRLEQFEMFWRRMSKLLLALHIIHEMGVENHGILSGIHQDIHPANIFVFPEPSGDSYDVRFKLGDFGATHVNRLRGRDGGIEKKRYNDGNMNRMYLAPECTPTHGIQMPPRISPTVDVWALGAVFSDALIWSFLGEDGRETYRKQRFEEIKSGSHELSAKGYDSCFHNGYDRLEAVSTMHDHALKKRLAEDWVSVEVSKLILHNMLQRDKSHAQTGRLDPRDLFRQISDTITHRTPRVLASSSALVQSPAPIYNDGNSIHHFPVLLPETPRRGRSVSYVSDLGVPIIQDSPVRQRMSLTESIQPQSPSSHQRSPNTDLRRASSRNSTTRGILKSTRSSVRGSYSSANGDFVDGTNLRQKNPSPESSQNCPNSHLAPSTLLGDYRGDDGDLRPSSDGRRRSKSVRRSAGPIVTVGNFYELLQKKHPIRGFRSQELGEEYSKLDNALGKVRSRGGRDQIFLIDDAGSMSHHKSKVEQTARVIAYAVKESDPDGMELYFASDMGECRKYKKSSKIENAIRDHSFRSNRTTSMAKCLAELLKSIPHRTKPGCDPRPVSIYVLTDAVWEEGDPGVDRCIVTEARRLSKEELPPSATMIQFIRFGDRLNRQASERVKYLDDDLVNKFDLGVYDIVDTRHCDGDVSEMLIGSISAVNDEISS